MKDTQRRAMWAKQNSRQLPIYKIKGHLYYLDKRLSEYRNVKNPFDVKRYDDPKVVLQKPTRKDSLKIWGDK